jgi:transposase InsO family protein
MHEGQTIIEKRGRKALPPMDYQQVRTEIRNLKHGKKRTAGTEALRDKYRGIISRSKLNELIAEVREEIKTKRSENMTHITWMCPHMVWSMDDFQYIFKGIKFYVHQVQDLTSKYKFDPIVSAEPVKGEEVAGNLKKLFKQYGAPLFMKRDNGSNLNHSAVIDILQEFRVIPLNNPAYYPQFNGSMERAQGETKQQIDDLI